MIRLGLVRVRVPQTTKSQQRKRGRQAKYSMQIFSPRVAQIARRTVKLAQLLSRGTALKDTWHQNVAVRDWPTSIHGIAIALSATGARSSMAKIWVCTVSDWRSLTPSLFFAPIPMVVIIPSLTAFSTIACYATPLASGEGLSFSSSLTAKSIPAHSPQWPTSALQ